MLENDKTAKKIQKTQERHILKLVVVEEILFHCIWSIMWAQQPTDAWTFVHFCLTCIVWPVLGHVSSKNMFLHIFYHKVTKEIIHIDLTFIFLYSCYVSQSEMNAIKTKSYN